MDAVFSGDESLTREHARGDRRAGREGRASSAAFPLLPGVPRRCGLPPHGAGQAHRQSRRGLSRSLSCRGAANRSPPPFAVKPDGCYLITGAFGGFGKVLAEWLVEMRRAAPRADAAAAALRRRKRRPSSRTCATQGVEVQRREGRRRLGGRRVASARGSARRRAAAARRVPSGHGHRRCAAGRAHPRADAHRHGAEGPRRMAAARRHAGAWRSTASSCSPRSRASSAIRRRATTARPMPSSIRWPIIAARSVCRR